MTSQAGSAMNRKTSFNRSGDPRHQSPVSAHPREEKSNSKLTPASGAGFRFCTVRALLSTAVSRPSIGPLVTTRPGAFFVRRLGIRRGRELRDPQLPADIDVVRIVDQVAIRFGDHVGEAAVSIIRARDPAEAFIRSDHMLGEQASGLVAGLIPPAASPKRPRSRSGFSGDRPSSRTIRREPRSTAAGPRR